MTEWVIQLNTSEDNQLFIWKKIYSISTSYHTQKYILVDQRLKCKKQNFRNVGKDVKKELVLPVGGDGGNVSWFEYFTEQFGNIKESLREVFIHIHKENMLFQHCL